VLLYYTCNVAPATIFVTPSMAYSVCVSLYFCYSLAAASLTLGTHAQQGLQYLLFLSNKESAKQNEAYQPCDRVDHKSGKVMLE